VARELLTPRTKYGHSGWRTKERSVIDSQRGSNDLDHRTLFWCRRWLAAWGVTVSIIGCMGPGGPAGRDGVDGAAGDSGSPGGACWDKNGDNVAAPTEDVNGDGVYDAADCSGAPGDGGVDGQACWDQNGNGAADLPEEDTNDDGVVDIADCRPEPVDVPPGFTGPGLLLSLSGPRVDAAGVVTVEVELKDAGGHPLDMDGFYTEGAVTPQLVLAALAAGGQYSAYTTRSATGAVLGTVTQAATDSGGTYTELGSGRYLYTFGKALPAGYDGTLTHTIGAYATRTADGKRFDDSRVLHFRPDGAAVTETREVVQSLACDSCHGSLGAHGGARRTTELCITCHSPQTADPDSGHSVDFKVMVHKIHSGEKLASVRLGTPYAIIGFRGSVNDYSNVKLPQDIRNCDSCHQGASADNWKTKPSRDGCGSCHDNVSFAAGIIDEGEPSRGACSANADCSAFSSAAQEATCNVDLGRCQRVHSVQTGDTACVGCHPASGAGLGLKPVAESHYTAYTDPDVLQSVELSIDGVSGAAAGASPTVDFTVTVNGVPRDIQTSALATLRLIAAGAPAGVTTPDYGRQITYTIPTNGTLVARDADAGQFSFTPTSPLPADAAGTWGFTMEGRVTGTNGVSYGAMNPIRSVDLGGGAALPRRVSVEKARCDNCHKDELRMHGGIRRNPQMCVFCHNPNLTNNARATLPPAGTTKPVESAHMKVMIHKIHMGEELTVQPYILGGFSSPARQNPIDFGEVRFPGDQADCAACHVEGMQALPLAEDVLPTLMQSITETGAIDGAQDYTIAPITAACGACHDTPDAAAHADIMTTSSGAESCGVCHGPGKEFDVEVVHLR
jgi:OmcA/MtrC family decaheme c-type cytochrome